METSSKPILVTGASGYLGSHIIKLLLEQGFYVRGAVHSLEQSRFLLDLVPVAKNNIKLFEADLLDHEKWDSIVQGCEYIIHTASPVPIVDPKDVEKHIIKPAVEGTKTILSFALKHNVKKVVITSAFVALWVGNEYRTVTEEFWGEETKEDAYARSKILAEKAVWEFYNANKGKIEITTLCPGLMLGPKLSLKENSSEEMIRQIMINKVPGIPDVNFAVVDVRDVASAHIKVLHSPQTNGKRYILANKSLGMKDIVEILANEFEKYGYEFNKKPLKRCAIKFGSMFNDKAKKVLLYVGKKVRFDNKLSVNEAVVTYRPVEETIIEMGYNLIKLGIVPDKIKK